MLVTGRHKRRNQPQLRDGRADIINCNAGATPRRRSPNQCPDHRVRGRDEGEAQQRTALKHTRSDPSSLLHHRVHEGVGWRGGHFSEVEEESKERHRNNNDGLFARLQAQLDRIVEESTPRTDAALLRRPRRLERKL